MSNSVLNERGHLTECTTSNLFLVRAGGDAGMFSGIIGGWSAGGPRSSLPITKEVKP